MHTITLIAKRMGYLLSRCKRVASFPHKSLTTTTPRRIRRRRCDDAPFFSLFFTLIARARGYIAGESYAPHQRTLMLLRK